MKPLLFYFEPRDAADQIVPIYLASVPSPAFAGLGGYRWDSAITRRPRLMFDLLSPDLDGQVQTGRGDLMVNLSQIRTVKDPDKLFWTGCFVRILDATNLDINNVGIEFTGLVASATLDIWTRQLSLTLAVDISRLDRPLLATEFSGGGGINGDADKRGTPHPAGFGYVENVEPVFFDETNNVGMLDGYANLTTVHGLFEGGSSLGPSVGNFATYALLVAANIPRGRWGTCLASGLIRLGAPPAGRISADCTFRGPAGTGANLPGSLIRRLLIAHCGLVDEDLDVNSFATLDVTVPRTVHYWTSDQRQVKDLAQAIAASCNASMVVLPNGRIAVTRAFGGAIVGAVNRAGTSKPQVTQWASQSPPEPVWRMRARGCRPGTVFSYSEILYEDDIIDRGVYSPTETYRQGHLVYVEDGSQWLYINATPSSGHAPPDPPATSDAYWQRTRPPSTAADLVYADGTPIENLKPAELGANITEIRTAAYIQNQGALANLDAVGAGQTTFRIGGGNLVGNSGFERSTAVAGMADGFGLYANSDGATTSLVPGRVGGLAQRVDWNANTTTKGIYLQNSGGVSNSGIWKANRTYIWSFYAKATGAAIGQGMSPAWNVGPVTGTAWVTNPPLTADWQRYILRVVWGATTDVNGFITVTPGTANGVSSLTIDDMQIEEGDLVSGYAPMGLPLLPNGVTYELLASTAARLGINLVRNNGVTTVGDNDAITSLGTAAYLFNQGLLATLSQLANGSQYLTGFGGLSALNSVALGAGNSVTFGLLTQAGFSTSDASLITSLGTAQYFQGQGALATMSQLANGSAYLTGFGLLSQRNYVKIGGGLEGPDSWPLLTNQGQGTTDNSIVTAQGTAQYILNQAAWATLSGVPVSRVNYLQNDGTLRLGTGLGLLNNAGTAWLTDPSVITNLGTAQYLQGQGLLATQNSVGGLQILGGTIASATGAMAFNLDTGRILFNNGTIMKVTGNAFGSANQFVEWLGPTQASIANCTELNAYYYVKTNGTIYTKATFLAGDLRSGNQNPSTAASVVSDTGSIGSNGGAIQVVASWFYSRTTTTNYPATSAGVTSFNNDVAFHGATDQGGGYYTADYTTGVGSNTLGVGKDGTVQTATTVTQGQISWSGVRPEPADSAPGNSTTILTVNASVTWPDPVQSTAARSFQAVLSRGTGLATPGIQRVAITSTEAS